MNQNISRHQNRVGKQTGVYIVGLLPGFVFKRSGALQFTQVGIHIQKSVQLRHFGHVALDKNGCFFRVDSAGKIFSQHLFHTRLQVFGSRVGCERMNIGNKKEAVVIVLHFYKTAHSPEIISQVQIPCGADSAQNGEFICHFL